VYCVEPQQNIALARNKALEHARGDLIAFIDDDEIPGEEWLLTLFSALETYGTDGVLGPVKPWFDSEPPKWVRNGKFFERPDHDSGYQLTWRECRTGNVLFRRSILDRAVIAFRPEFATAGEDMDFFRRMIDKDCRFVWCREAAVYELVPPSRCRRTFLLKRALLRGSSFPKHPTGRIRSIIVSAIAVPTYVVALPVLLLFGEHMVLKYVVKLCDHGSRLLAFAGWPVINERET
jgi:succinoglycan biosynthesis protein ExoM